MQSADRLVEKSNQDEERHELSDCHPSMQNSRTPKAGNDDEPTRGKKVHRRRINCPCFHNDQRRLLQPFTRLVESPVFRTLPHIRLYLPDPGKIIVQNRVHFRRRLALSLIPRLCRQGVD